MALDHILNRSAEATFDAWLASKPGLTRPVRDITAGDTVMINRPDGTVHVEGTAEALRGLAVAAVAPETVLVPAGTLVECEVRGADWIRVTHEQVRVYLMSYTFADLAGDVPLEEQVAYFEAQEAERG